MKHKVLISVDRGFNNSEFLERTKTLLNTSHSKFLTGISLYSYLQRKVVTANHANGFNGFAQNEEQIDFEISLEQTAAQMGMQFDMLRKEVDDSSLTTLSAVADLLIVDRKVLQHFCGEDVLVDLIKAVSCPVLVLPERKEIESLIMVHDGTLSAIQAVKHFISLFNLSLRDLPVSVFVSDPESKMAIEGEKIFVDYLKLFFSDIGIQLMNEEPVDCLVNSIMTASYNPMLIMGEERGSEVLQCNLENRIITDNAPTFIYKTQGN